MWIPSHFLCKTIIGICLSFAESAIGRNDGRLASSARRTPVVHKVASHQWRDPEARYAKRDAPGVLSSLDCVWLRLIVYWLRLDCAWIILIAFDLHFVCFWLFLDCVRLIAFRLLLIYFDCVCLLSCCFTANNANQNICKRSPWRPHSDDELRNAERLLYRS